MGLVEAMNRFLAVRRFLRELETVPWFQRIGQRLPPNTDAVPLRSWEDWPGPEEPAIGALSLRQQALYDRIMTAPTDKQAKLKSLWVRVHQIVFRLACPSVPFDDREDAWHAPTTAVWQAAWAAGLITLCTIEGIAVPSELQKEWEWFCRGHWPAGYSALQPDGTPGPLLIF
jgi:hypothetical protein